MAANRRVGVLLCNLGTPSALSKSSIRRFLRAFLMDERVIDLPRWQRFFLVYGLILPSRPRRILPQYQQIWREEGSPLLVHSWRLQQRLSIQLGERYQVELGMRYGEPSLEEALQRLLQRPLSQLVVIPLYPQYASSTTGSIFSDIFRLISHHYTIPSLHLLSSFYDRPDYLRVLAQSYKTSLESFEPDHILFSYHGIPRRQLCKDPWHEGALCSDEEPCPLVDLKNQSCYRAQCYETSRLLAQSLSLSEEMYQTVFQSFFGRVKWIGPALPETLHQLRALGKKRLAIATPSFVTDCLETLEEVGQLARRTWLSLGGEDLLLLPSLNDNEAWVSVLSQWVRDQA